MYPAHPLKLCVSILSTISFGVLFTNTGKLYHIHVWHVLELYYQHVYFVGCMCYVDESLNYNENVNFEEDGVICYFYIYSCNLKISISISNSFV